MLKVEEKPIGRLVWWEEPGVSSGHVLSCEDCYQARERETGRVRSASKVFRVNVFPYRGTCKFCSKVLVEPATSRWPELFDGCGSEREYPAPESKVVDLSPEQCRFVAWCVNGKGEKP